MPGQPRKKAPRTASIRLKRVYEPAAPEDGARFLVDRLWPRGLKKESLEIAAWLKDAAPSHALRREFHGDPSRWDEFRRAYFAELDAAPEHIEPLLEAARKGPVTLLYAAKDPAHNNATALREHVLRRHS